MTSRDNYRQNRVRQLVYISPVCIEPAFKNRWDMKKSLSRASKRPGSYLKMNNIGYLVVKNFKTFNRSAG